MADSEGDERADVAEDGGADGLGDLLDVLVGECQYAALFPSAKKDPAE